MIMLGKIMNKFITNERSEISRSLKFVIQEQQDRLFHSDYDLVFAFYNSST